MALNEHQMDPAEVRRLLELLTQRLTDEGVAASIHVIGGSAIALMFPDDTETRFTTAIDAAVTPRDAVLRAVEELADELQVSKSSSP